MTTVTETIAPSAATPHDLLNAGLISVGDTDPATLTDGITFINIDNTAGDRLGQSDAGVMSVRTEHGEIPLQPGTVLNVISRDEQGTFASTHYIDETGSLRNVLSDEQGLPWYPPVVTNRWEGISATNNAIIEDAIAPEPREPRFMDDGVIEHSSADVVGAANFAPAVAAVHEWSVPDEPVPAYPRPDTSGYYTEEHAQELRDWLTMEDSLARVRREREVLADAAAIVDGAGAPDALQQAENIIERAAEGTVYAGGQLAAAGAGKDTAGELHDLLEGAMDREGARESTRQLNGYLSEHRPQHRNRERRRPVRALFSFLGNVAHSLVSRQSGRHGSSPNRHQSTPVPASSVRSTQNESASV
jgi:hypothetical protein